MKKKNEEWFVKKAYFISYAREKERDLVKYFKGI